MTRTEYGFNNVFVLDVDRPADRRCMVKDYGSSTLLRRELTHIDFYVVDPEQHIVTIEVPVSTTGVRPSA